MAEAAMTPPTGKAKAAPKAAAPKAADGEKKERAPRFDYGFLPGATITVDTAKETSFRGQTQEWYDRLLKSNGKTVEHFLDNNQGITNKQGKPEPPRGWLRHFCKTGYASLSGGSKPEPKPKAAPKAKAKEEAPAK